MVLMLVNDYSREGSFPQLKMRMRGMLQALFEELRRLDRPIVSSAPPLVLPFPLSFSPSASIVHIDPFPILVHPHVELPLPVVRPLVAQERIVELHVIVALRVHPVADDARIGPEVLVSAQRPARIPEPVRDRERRRSGGKVEVERGFASRTRTREVIPDGIESPT